jgi:hypothetical protein
MSEELKRPGEIAQRSGQYEITGSRGGGTGEERTVTKYYSCIYVGKRFDRLR